MSQVPAATRALRILRYLASQPEPVPLAHIARAVGVPRSSAYHLLTAMIDEGFVMHVADQRRFGLGFAAYEVGSGYARQEPLQRISRLPLARLVDRLGLSAHLVVLEGRDVLYVLEERAPHQPSLVSDVGVRLPAHLTASGRAMLAAMPRAQVRAILPSPALLVRRTEAGPRSMRALRAILDETSRRGYAIEAEEVTEGLASVAAPVRDHHGYPIAAVAVTYPVTSRTDVPGAAQATRELSSLLTARLGGV